MLGKCRVKFVHMAYLSVIILLCVEGNIKVTKRNGESAFGDNVSAITGLSYP